MRYPRLWRRFFVNALVREAEYRASFALAALEGLSQVLLVILTFELIYQFSDAIAGWRREQVLLLVGVYRIVDGIVSAQVTPNMLALPGYVRTGELDFHLLRPVSSQFLVSTRRLTLPEVTNVLIGLGLVAYAAGPAGVVWNALALAQALVLLLCGLVLLYAVWFAIMTCSIWLVQLDTLESLFFSLFQSAQYPVHFFSGAARALFTFVFPVAFATTFPTEALLGRADLRLVPLGLALAGAALLGTHVLWRRALRHYESASS
ncbi:MAG TPA: ABC-2 family transporter protein [Chloroflexota bacterium]